MKTLQLRSRRPATPRCGRGWTCSTGTCASPRFHPCLGPPKCSTVASPSDVTPHAPTVPLAPRARLLPLQHHARPPTPSPLAPHAINTPAPPRRPLSAVPLPVLVPTSSCAPPSLASLLPHSHLAPRPLPELRSPLLPPLLTLVFLSLPPTQARHGPAELPHLLGLGVGGHPLSRAARLPSSCTSA